jgi:hypothetical protein
MTCSQTATILVIAILSACIAAVRIARWRAFSEIAKEQVRQGKQVDIEM